MNIKDIKNIMYEYQEYSYPKVSQVGGGWFENNSDIRWYANCVGDFDDGNISEFYLNDSYSKKTRWDLWNDIVLTFEEMNIKTNLDIGASNNHFSFLCNNKNIFSVGIEPREDCLNSSSKAFIKYFGSDDYGYVGTFKTFSDFFDTYNEKIFDCITILNFLHGNDNIPEEIEKLFKVLPKVTNKILISNPQWSKLGIRDYTKKYNVLKIFNDTANHILYEIGEN